MGKERKRKAKKTTSSTKKKGNFFLTQCTLLKFLKIDSLQQEITSMYHGDGILQDHVQSKTAESESYFEFFPYQSSNFFKTFFSFLSVNSMTFLRCGEATVCTYDSESI